VKELATNQISLHNFHTLKYNTTWKLFVWKFLGRNFKDREGCVVE